MAYTNTSNNFNYNYFYVTYFRPRSTINSAVGKHMYVCVCVCVCNAPLIIILGLKHIREK